VELLRGEWDLALVFMFAGKRKLWELKEWLKENKESFEKGKEYFITLLPLFRREGIEFLKEVGVMKKEEFVIDIAENLRYLKSLGFKVKTYEEIFGEGKREGLKEGLQRGLEQGLQQGLQEGLQQGLQRGLQEGLREAILLGLELRFGEVGLRYRKELEEIKRIETLKELKKTVLKVKDMKEFEEILRKVKK
jgi:flagellar biosynthesis/type III secretory pathway protein FliH